MNMDLFNTQCASCCPVDDIPNWAVGFRFPSPINSKHVGYYFKNNTEKTLFLDGEPVFAWEEALAAFDGSTPGWVQMWEFNDIGQPIVCFGPDGDTDPHPWTNLIRGFVQIRRWGDGT